MRRMRLDAVLNHWPEIASVAMRVAYTGTAFLITVLLARLLSPHQLGDYFEIIAWVLLIGTIVQSGWAPFLVREVSALHETGRISELNGIIWLAVRLVAVGAVAAALVMLVTAYLEAADRARMAMVGLAALAIPIISTSSLRQAITRGMGHGLLGQICETVARPGLQLAVLGAFWIGLFTREFDDITAIAAFLFATIMTAILAFVIERRVTQAARDDAARVIPPRSEWLGSLVRNALIGWSGAVNLQIGVLTLANAATKPDVAVFRLAQQLSMLIPIGLTAVAAVYAPQLSRSLAREDYRTAQSLAGKGALFSLLAALPVAGCFILFGGELSRFLFGEQYAAAYAPLIVLSVGQLANAAFGLVTVTAVAARSEAAAVRAHAISACANLVLCIMLVPRMGAMGAAYASAVSLVLWNVQISAHLSRRFGIRSFVRLGLPLGLSSRRT